MNRLYKLVLLLVVFLFQTAIYAQESSIKYNKAMQITEYYNAEGVMIGFSRVNKERKRIDHYNMKGKLLKWSPIENDSILASIQKKTFPKSQLSQQELDAVSEQRYETIEGVKLIRELKPDLELIGYYNYDGKLLAYRKYHRGLEEWIFYWIKNEKPETEK